MKRRFAALFAVMLVLALLVSACGSTNKTPTQPAPSNTSAGPEQKQITIGVALDELFLGRQTELKGIEAAAQKANVKLIQSVADGNPQQQNSQIESFINQKVNAILVAAVDQAAIATALKKAADAKIPVITFDRELPGDPSVVFHTGFDSLGDGRACGKYVAEQLGQKKVTVLELLGALNDQNAIDRSKGFEEGLAAAKNVTLVKGPTDWNADKALAATENALQANPDIAAVFIPSDFMQSAVETALKNAGKLAKVGEPNHVILCGVDGSKPGYESTKAGLNDGLAVLDLAKVGGGALEAAVKLAKGETLSEKKVGYPGKFFTYKDIEQHASEVWGAQ